MIPPETEQLNIISDAWPERKRMNIQQKSETHDIITDLLQQYTQEEILSKISFRNLNTDDLEEIRKHHLEWFPLSYPDDFYAKILHKNGVIAVGCFINTIDFSKSSISINQQMNNLNLENQDEEEKQQTPLNNNNHEIMLGSIISKVKVGNDDIVWI